MNLRILLTLIITAAVLTPAEARDAAPAVITHVADAKKTTTTIRFSEEIKLILPVPADSPAAYEWQIMSNDSRILRLTSSPRPGGTTEKTATEKSATPAATTWTATFLALRPGKSTVRFVYVPSANNPVETPIDSREIVVNVR
jgi:predicted secreted protein